MGSEQGPAQQQFLWDNGWEYTSDHPLYISLNISIIYDNIASNNIYQFHLFRIYCMADIVLSAHLILVFCFF